VRNGVLQRIQEERNSLRAIKRRKANWMGHILARNCLLKHVIEEKIEGGIYVTRRRERRRMQPLNDQKKTIGCSKFKEEAPDRILWTTRSVRCYGLVA
jgi:hypothetical protein